jgi:hypothetical protein
MHLAHDLNFHPLQHSSCTAVTAQHHQFLEMMASNLYMPVYILIGNDTHVVEALCCKLEGCRMVSHEVDFF